MIKFKKGDEVLITSGKDKGRKAKIEKIFARKALALVPGVNTYKKHKKATANEKGSIIELSRPLAFAKIALVCPNCEKQTRVQFKIEGKAKSRVCAKCKKTIDTGKSKGN